MDRRQRKQPGYRAEVNIQIVDPQVLTLARAADFVAKTTGVKPHLNTITRWVQRGVRGHRLRAMRVGRAFVTTKSDVLDLLERLNDFPACDSGTSAKAVIASQRAELSRVNHAALAQELGIDG